MKKQSVNDLAQFGPLHIVNEGKNVSEEFFNETFTDLKKNQIKMKKSSRSEKKNSAGKHRQIERPKKKIHMHKAA